MTLYSKVPYLFVATLSLVLQGTTGTTPLTYAMIGNLVLQAEPAIKNQTTIPARWLADLPDRAEPSVADLSIKVPLKFEQERLIFSLLHTFNPINTVIPQLLESEGLDSLALISKQSPTSYCLLDRFPCITTSGKAVTAQFLALPISDSRLLQKRQLILSELTNNAPLLTSLTSLLNLFAISEPILLTFFEPNNSLIKKVFDSMYFKNPAYNKNIYAMALLRAWQSSSPLFVLPRNTCLHLKVLLFTKLSHYADRQLFDINIGNITPEHSPASEFRWYELGKKLDYYLGNPQEITQSQQGEIKWYAFFLGVSLAEMAIRHAMQEVTPQLADEALLHMKTKLHVAAASIAFIEKLEALVQSHQPLLANLPEIAAILHNFTHHQSPAFQQLQKLLKSGTFHGESSFLDSTRILVAFTLLEECKELFIPLFEAIGTIDAFVAAAQFVIKENNKVPGSYSFVDFVDQTDPAIVFEDFANPLMATEDAIANSLNIGPDGDRNLIITGPNGSGKSVFMKSIALNLVLAQSFGIAAAQKATITPFDAFHIYLNVQESLELSLSTFMAEKKKLDAICDKINRQPAACKSFTLIDEGLKGTVEQSGGPLIYQAGLTMGANSSNICLLATHFKKPTDLESAMPGRFKNCHLKLLETNEGSFERTFKLEREINDWWFADDAKRERFMIWLTNLALASSQ